MIIRPIPETAKSIIFILVLVVEMFAFVIALLAGMDGRHGHAIFGLLLAIYMHLKNSQIF